MPTTAPYCIYDAFGHCLNLIEVTIPDSIKIPDYSQYPSFGDCPNLIRVIFTGTINESDLFSSAFTEIGDLRSVYIAGGPGTYTRTNGSTTWTKE